MERIFAAACLTVLLACGSAPHQGVTPVPGHRDIITTVEIESYRTSGMTAFDIVSHLRPEYLKNRGINSFRQTMPPTATVYLNGMEYGDLQTLKSIDGAIVTQFQYLSGNDATTRFGTDHSGGAILVFTR